MKNTFQSLERYIGAPLVKQANLSQACSSDIVNTKTQVPLWLPFCAFVHTIEKGANNILEFLCVLLKNKHLVSII